MPTKYFVEKLWHIMMGKRIFVTGLRMAIKKRKTKKICKYYILSIIYRRWHFLFMSECLLKIDFRQGNEKFHVWYL